MKKTISVLVALVMLLSCATLGLVSAAGGDEVAVVETGSCGAEGSDVTYTLYIDGRLVIKGSGTIMNHAFNAGAGIVTVSNAIQTLTKHIVIEDGITAIGNSAFAFLQFQDIDFGNTVESIGSDVFYDSDNFEEILLPKSVKTVGSDAFGLCSRLKKVTLGHNVESIGDWTFLQCYALEKIIFLNGNTEIIENDHSQYFEILNTIPTGVIYSYGGGSVEAYARSHNLSFIPLCPTDATHTVTEKDKIAPTCTAAGHEPGFYCENCAVYVTGGAEIAATGHQHTATVAETEPTRTAHGYTEGEFCSDCQTFISGHEVIHNQYGERTEIKPATVDEEGEVEIVCTVCGGKGLYALEKLEKPGQKDDDNFFRKLAKGVINFFLRLIKWLGGGK